MRDNPEPLTSPQQVALDRQRFAEVPGLCQLGCVDSPASSAGNREARIRRPVIVVEEADHHSRQLIFRLSSSLGHAR